MKTLSVILLLISICQSVKAQTEAKINFLGGVLRSSPDANSPEIMTLKSGEMVVVLEYAEKPFFKVSYKDSIGFISYASLEKSPKLDDIIFQEMSATNPRLATLTKVHGSVMAEKIISGELKGQYWIGMNDYLAIELLGFPDKKNTSVGSWGKDEQWVYNNKKLYLYFTNGILKSYQK